MFGFRLIDWMMHLPAALSQRFEHNRQARKASGVRGR